MSIDYAMTYEHIVRKANNNCGRYGTAGADADIYRHLERVWARGFDGKNCGTVEQRYLALGEVTAFLRDSFERIIKSGAYSDDINRSIQAISDSLFEPSLVKIQNSLCEVSGILVI